MRMPCVNDNQRFFNPQQAADLLGLSKSYLDKLRIQGGGPQFHKFGNRIRYDSADLNAWADARRYANTSEITLSRTA